jgi:hypothetical protein
MAAWMLNADTEGNMFSFKLTRKFADGCLDSEAKRDPAPNADLSTHSPNRVNVRTLWRVLSAIPGRSRGLHQRSWRRLSGACARASSSQASSLILSGSWGHNRLCRRVVECLRSAPSMLSWQPDRFTTMFQGVCRLAGLSRLFFW